MHGLSSTFNSAQAYRQPAHRHDAYMVMMPRHGLMQVTDEDSQWSTALLERQFLLVPPERQHSTACLSATQSHLIFYIDADTMAYVVRDLAGDTDRFLRKPAMGIWATTPGLQHLLLARAHMQDGPAAPGRAQRLARMDHLLLLECAATALSGPGIQRSTTQRHGAALVREVKAWLAARLDVAPDIDAIAAAFHLSRRHLTRLFTDHTGHSVLETIQALRMARARDLLDHTGLSVLDIAQSVGFQSPSHFAALFRRKHGLAPDEWRRARAIPMT